MGGCTFWTKAEGKTAREAFDAAVKEARYQHGYGGFSNGHSSSRWCCHSSYTGTIAEKRSFILIPVPAGEDPGEFAQQLLEDQDPRVDDKWGPAGCIKLAEGKWLFFGWASS